MEYVYTLLGLIFVLQLYIIAKAGTRTDDSTQDFHLQELIKRNSELEKELDREKLGFDELYKDYKKAVYAKKIGEENLEIAHGLIEYQIKQLEEPTKTIVPKKDELFITASQMIEDSAVIMNKELPNENTI